MLEEAKGTDAAALVQAIERAAARLSKGEAGVDEQSHLASAITAHAGHSRSSVRQAVAEAALRLPDAAFEEVITRLLGDANQFVKRAATRSYDERSRRARVVREQVEQSAGIRQLRERIERAHRADGLRAADRLCELTVAQFVASLTHELVKAGDALGASLVDLRGELAKRAGTAPLTQQAESAHATVVALLGIVRAAGVHAAVTAPSFHEIAVSSLIEEQLAFLRARLGDGRRARLRVSLEVDPSLTIDCDRGLLGQALSNVLQNAVEAYPADGSGETALHVATEREKAGTLVGIVVRDFGRGIDAATLGRLGEPFVSSNGSGRGLGMLNVKKMVETVHGGRVDVDSEAGKGTRVAMVLPRKQPNGEARRARRRLS